MGRLLRGLPLLAILGLSLLSRGVTAGTLEEGYALERSGDLDAALTVYRHGLSDDAPRKAAYLRQIGSVLAKQKNLPGAIEAYDQYLELAPADTKIKAYNETLRTALARLRQSVDPEDPYAQFGRPRDHKLVQVVEEILSPAILGTDVSFYLNRHHNFGVGLSAFPGFQLYHPRWRYYRARWNWDSFFEVGGLFGGLKYGYGSASSTTTLTGGDLAYGVNVITGGIWTQEFILSLNYLNISETFVDSDGTSHNYGVAVPYPLIGWGFGLVF